MDPEQYVEFGLESSGGKQLGFRKFNGKQIGNNNYEEKKVAVEEEMNRISRLPPNSSYASHRLRVLNKILHLLSLQRTTSQDEELELLFAGLHI